MYNTLKLYSTGWQNEERRASASCEVILYEIYNSKSKFYNTLKLYSTGWQNEEQGSSWKVVTGGESLARDQLSRRAKIITSPLLALSEGLKYSNTNIGNNSFRQIQTGITRFARLAKKIQLCSSSWNPQENNSYHKLGKFCGASIFCLAVVLC